MTERTQVAVVRRAARDLARVASMPEDDAHRVGIVATELASNLVKHSTSGGEVLMRVHDGRATPTVELIAIDRGPGIVDLGQAMADGHSTAGSAGTGLGAVRRMSSTFDVYSQREQGTIILAEVTTARREADLAPPAYLYGGVSVPIAGERVCGDAWLVRVGGDGMTAVIADGLGHGVHARAAATAAIESFAGRAEGPPAAVVARIHQAIRHTRGAAVAVADVRRGAAALTYAGLGNTSGVVVTPTEQRHAVSANGTAGHEARSIHEYSYPWTREATLVLHTDGLSGHWTLDRHPGLRRCHPTVIAAAIYREASRGRDDATVVVVREAS